MIIVVTGGIGSGKSAVCGILSAEYDIPVYEADRKVKELYGKYPSLVLSIEDSLEMSLRDEQGRFVPSQLADRIFTDRDALEKVESLVFPLLKQDFCRWMEEHAEAVHHVFESATILEKPYFDGFGDLVVLVDAPLSLRIRRAAERDGADIDAVKRRSSNQALMNLLSQGVADERIGYVINNDSDIGSLHLKVDEFARKYILNKNVSY